VVVAVMVLAATGIVTWRAFGPATRGLPRAGPTPTHQGYFIDLPDLSTGVGPVHGYWTLTATTNLPDGTMYEAKSASTDGFSEGLSCCEEVQGGVITVRAGDDPCYRPVGSLGNGGATFTFEVRPVFDDFVSHGPPPLPGPSSSPRQPPTQPASVLAVLGEHFEGLTGDQVVVDGGVRELIATRTYTWTPRTCDIRDSELNPQACDGPPDGHLQGDPDSIMVDLTGALSQARLCEIWAADMTSDFQAANPWPVWRDTMETWIDGLGSLASDDPGKVHGIAWTFLVKTDEHVVADLELRGRTIAEVEAIHLPDPPGAGPNLVPFWGFTRFDPA
jgi:hypothetical protein